MSAAFDTINRRHLLDIVKSIVDEDEHRLIQFHLSGTVIHTRINGTSTSKKFHKQCRHPTGRQLKPGSIYYIFRKCSQRNPTVLPRPTTSFEEEISSKVAYADDVDFTGQNYADIKKIKEV